MRDNMRKSSTVYPVVLSAAPDTEAAPSLPDNDQNTPTDLGAGDESGRSLLARSPTNQPRKSLFRR